MASLVGEERDSNTEFSESDSDVQDGLSEAEEHPWPYLKSMFEFAQVKNVDTDKKTYASCAITILAYTQEHKVKASGPKGPFGSRELQNTASH